MDRNKQVAIGKIQKLRAIVACPTTAPTESECASNRIKYLMELYQIEEGEILVAEGLVTDREVLYASGEGGPKNWQEVLLRGLSNDAAKVILLGPKEDIATRLTILGTKAAIAGVFHLYNSMATEIEKTTEEWAAENPSSAQDRTNFRFGMAFQIAKRMTERLQPVSRIHRRLDNLKDTIAMRLSKLSTTRPSVTAFYSGREKGNKVASSEMKSLPPVSTID